MSLFISAPAYAATSTWAVDANGKWSVPADWSSTTVPTSGTSTYLIFDNTGTGYTSKNDLGVFTVHGLTFNNTGTGTITLNGDELQFSAASINVTGSAKIANDITGNITKNGTGDLTLTGTGTSLGPILVNEGGLTVKGSLTQMAGQNLTVGTTAGQEGDLTITGTGLVESGAVTIANVAGSTGVVIVKGGTLDTTTLGSGSIAVGKAGTGTLTVNNGGQVLTTGIGVGGTAGSTGTVNVSGAGTVLNSTGGFVVGGSGSGTVSLTDGGTINSGGVNVANNTGSTGTVTISGNGSNWNSTGQSIIGNSGTGSVTVSGQGASWTGTGQTVVGNIKSGTVTVENGASVSSNGILLGAIAGSSGTVTISGHDSSWDSSDDDIVVGNSGSGSISITHGGLLSSSSAIIGNLAGGSGSVTVSGSNSSWTNTGELNVGLDGTGTLAITNGGSVTTDSIEVGADSSVTVSGHRNGTNSSLDLTVGNAYIDQGGQVILQDRGNLTIELGYGALYIADGGTLTIGNGSSAGTIDANEIILGNNVDSVGTAEVEFSQTNRTEFSTYIGGNGTVIQDGTGTTILETTNDYSGETYIESGKVEVNNYYVFGDSMWFSTAAPLRRKETVIMPSPLLSVAIIPRMGAT